MSEPAEFRQRAKQLLGWGKRTASGRLAGFAAVGITVFAFGVVLLFGLVHYARVEPHLAYFVVAVVSVEASFVLNRAINWRDRPGRLVHQLAAFHATKVVTIILNQVLFAILLALGIWYILAMVSITALITVINFVANDRLVFRHRAARAQSPPLELEAGRFS